MFLKLNVTEYNLKFAKNVTKCNRDISFEIWQGVLLNMIEKYQLRFNRNVTKYDSELIVKIWQECD